jgi:DNA replication protein DnaC
MAKPTETRSQPISESLNQQLPATVTILPLSPVPASEKFENVRLTEEEISAALLEARERKHYRLLDEERAARAAELRRQLTEHWSYEKTKDFIQFQIRRKFPDKNLTFEDSETSNAGTIFELFCRYFSNDPKFTELALAAGVKRPDLRKGWLLSGTVGNGKTTLMRLFCINQRQVFMVKSAAETANIWLMRGEEAIADFYEPRRLPINDIDNFYQPYAGLCLDDCGTEDVKNHFGNRVNVIGQIIEGRYFNQACGVYFHMTTNLNADQMKEFYGPRVMSRLRETMNVIQYKGEDRRK